MQPTTSQSIDNSKSDTKNKLDINMNVNVNVKSTMRRKANIDSD